MKGLRKIKQALRSVVFAGMPPSIALYRVRTSGKRIGLTFDDGPHPTNTPILLDILKRYDARATFFLVGESAAAYPELVARIVREGHAVGSHTQSHCDLSQADRATVERELEESSRSIFEAGGGEVRYFRPPWGKYGWGVMRAARKKGLRLALWSVDSQDWQLTDPHRIVERLKNIPLTSGDLLLLHDDYKHTVEALPGLLTYLTQRGWQCVTLLELEKCRAVGQNA